MIPGELENLESLVRLARQKDLEATENQVSMVSAVPTLRKIYINKTHRNKTLHLFVEINNYVVEGLVDTSASTFVMAVIVVRELGIMHLVIESETYKITSRVVTQALGRIDDVLVKVGGVQCTMVVDTNNYNVLLGLDFSDKNWCNCGRGTGFNTSEAWSRSSCGSITINYGKYVEYNELRNFDVRCCCCFGEHTSQWSLGGGY